MLLNTVCYLKGSSHYCGCVAFLELSGFAVILEKLHSCLRANSQVTSCCLRSGVRRERTIFIEANKGYSYSVRTAA